MDVIGHPTGRLIERREPYALDLDAVIAKAVETGTFLEINANPDRRDLNDVYARAAAEAGVTLVIDSDAHWPRTLANMRYGVATARRAWLTAEHVANTRPWAELDKLRKRGQGAQAGSILRRPGQPQQLGGPNGERAVEPELHAVAALDRLHRARLLCATASATSRMKPGRHRRHLREEEADRARERPWPAASGQSRLNMTAPGSSSGSELRAARARRAGAPMPSVVSSRRAQPQAGERRHAPPAARHVDERVRRPRARRRRRTRRRAPSRPPPNRSTDTRRKSRNLTARRAPRGPRCMPADAVDRRVAPLHDLGRALVRAHADAHGVVELARVDQRVERVEGVEVGRVVAGEQRRARPGPARAARARRGPCRSAPAAGSRAPCGPSGSHRPSASASCGDPPHERVGGLLVGRAAPVEGHDRALVLDPHAQQRAARGVSRSRANAWTSRQPNSAKAGMTRGLAAAGLEQLRAVGPA